MCIDLRGLARRRLYRALERYRARRYNHPAHAPDRLVCQKSTEAGGAHPPATVMTSSQGYRLLPALTCAGRAIRLVFEDSCDFHVPLHSTTQGSEKLTENRITNNQYLSGLLVKGYILVVQLNAL